jgi:hypothetical protein
VADSFKKDEVKSAAYLNLGKVHAFFTSIELFAYTAEVGVLLYHARTVSSLVKTTSTQLTCGYLRGSRMTTGIGRSVRSW